MNPRPRRSSAYINIMNVTAAAPNAVSMLRSVTSERGRALLDATLSECVRVCASWSSFRAVPRPRPAFAGVAVCRPQGERALVCAYLAAAVFLGLAGNALFGGWWLDPIAALFIARRRPS
jgi:hypothetical protein